MTLIYVLRAGYEYEDGPILLVTSNKAVLVEELAKAKLVNEWVQMEVWDAEAGEAKEREDWECEYGVMEPQSGAKLPSEDCALYTRNEDGTVTRQSRKAAMFVDEEDT